MHHLQRVSIVWSIPNIEWSFHMANVFRNPSEKLKEINKTFRFVCVGILTFQSLAEKHASFAGDPIYTSEWKGVAPEFRSSTFQTSKNLKSNEPNAFFLAQGHSATFWFSHSLNLCTTATLKIYEKIMRDYREAT